jgi:rhodanese-related sulfurtransferase
MSTTTLKKLSFADAAALVDGGAVFVDLRDVEAYLDVHIPGSIELFYEAGPGLASRARDCLPLEWPLILLDLGAGDIDHVAASLRGKGFDVAGSLTDGLNEWAAARGTPSSTEVIRGGDAPEGLLLDVGDPGTTGLDDAVRIPVERLWSRRDEIGGEHRVVVGAGYGIRAALAVGLLERAGVNEVVFWKSTRA